MKLSQTCFGFICKMIDATVKCKRDGCFSESGCGMDMTRDFSVILWFWEEVKTSVHEDANSQFYIVSRKRVLKLYSAEMIGLYVIC
jgi:hypothetical protein